MAQVKAMPKNPIDSWMNKKKYKGAQKCQKPLRLAMIRAKSEG
jgi:hypothetical protein